MNKTNLLFAGCMVLMMASCQKESATSYTISGTIDGLPDGTHVVLTPISHEEESSVADTIVTGSKFTFVGTAPAEPLAVRFHVKGGYGGLMMMLENGSAEITGKATSEKRGVREVLSLSDLKITGSTLSDKYKQLLSVRESLNTIYDANRKKFAAINAAYIKARGEKNQAAIDSIAQSPEGKEQAVAERKFFAAVDSTYHAVVDANKDSFWGPLMMISFTTYLRGEDSKAWYESLSQTAKDSYYGKKVKEELFPAGTIGTPVATFVMKDQDGKDHTLPELSKGKKYVLLDFWASWCQPCRKEIPNMKKAYAEFAPKGFEIISISIDKQKNDWLKALKEENLPWPNFLDVPETGISKLFKIKLIPTVYLLDDKGVIVAEDLRGKALTDKLNELLE